VPESRHYLAVELPRPLSVVLTYTLDMAFREKIFDNLVGDLEYHPKRALLYLALGVAALSVWAFASHGQKVVVVRMVFAAGGVALLLKGIFLLRKTSDGLGRSTKLLDLGKLEIPEPFPLSTPRTFPPLPAVVAQLTQDFGAGALLLGPLLRAANVVTDYSNNLPSFQVSQWRGPFLRRLADPSSHSACAYSGMNSGYDPKVIRNASSTSSILAKCPMTLSISDSWMVATLSAMITEFISPPGAARAFALGRTTTLLGCPARAHVAGNHRHDCLRKGCAELVCLNNQRGTPPRRLLVRVREQH
jgi:hypothetical protein